MKESKLVEKLVVVATYIIECQDVMKHKLMASIGKGYVSGRISQLGEMPVCLTISIRKLMKL